MTSTRNPFRFLASVFSKASLFLVAVGLVVTGASAQPTHGADPKVSTRKVATSPPLDPRLASLQPRAVSRELAPFPMASTFSLNSRSTATKTIYLDFDGHVTKGTFWNDGFSASITTSPFSFEGSAAFSDVEKTRIQLIWQRVAEFFSPFDVNVTTAAPTVANLINTGGTDTRWGIRVCIGAASPSPAPGAGGVSYVDIFGWDNRTGNDTPAFVFSPALSNNTKYVADAIVHEVGHALGLDHDGRITPSEEYYVGHGSGATKWAPIMGAGYYANLVQWSKGEYASASVKEDDLAIITTNNGFGYRADDWGNTLATAKPILGTQGTSLFTINQSGVIERRTDVDWFKITTRGGAMTVNALGGPANTMLDISMSLYDSTGRLIVNSNPSTTLTASISRSVTAGTYYIAIDGVGLGTATTGYTDYGSLGQYRITGTYP